MLSEEQIAEMWIATDDPILHYTDIGDLVRQIATKAYRLGQRDEREACAELMDDKHPWSTAATLIRARGEKS